MITESGVWLWSTAPKAAGLQLTELNKSLYPYSLWDWPQGLTQSKHSINAGDGEDEDFSNGNDDGDGEDDVDVMIMNIKGFSMFLP